MRKLLLAVVVLAFATSSSEARTILFIGNSFTFAANSPAHFYKSETVTDLNGPAANGKTVGGVPAIFKAFTKEAGLDYTVNLETVGGQGLDFHFAQKRALLDKSWDDVVMHGYSTLDQAHPGDPTLLISSARQMANLLRTRNSNVKIYLTATWSRADQTYPEKTPWHGKPIEQMGKDIAAAYDQAAKNIDAAGVVPMGLALNRAIDTGFADANPYDGIEAGKVDIWSYDNYHASIFGYYLEALLVFGKVTGQDPTTLGRSETVAEDMGFSAAQTTTLQQIAHDELAASH
jgi:hypothetical protein